MNESLDRAGEFVEAKGTDDSNQTTATYEERATLCYARSSWIAADRGAQSTCVLVREKRYDASEKCAFQHKGMLTADHSGLLFPYERLP